MRYKKIVVIGGSGFVGRAIVQELAHTGARIRIGCRHVKEAHFLQTMGEVGQISIVACDATSASGLVSLIQGSDVVINLLGLMVEKGKQNFQGIHVDAAARIASIAVEQNVQRLIHMSALGADIRSASAYARTKAQGEAAVKQACPAATMIRPSLVFGHEDHFFNLFARIALTSPVLPLIGGGTTRFQPVYVKDVARAIVNMLEREDTQGQVYELGGPQAYSFRELMELMLRVIRRKRLLIPLPYGLASWMGRLLELFPSPILTRDQVTLLKTDAVPQSGAPGLKDLDIVPHTLEAVLPLFMKQFQPHF